MKAFSIKILLPFLTVALLSSCTTDNDDGMSCVGDYDQKALLTHMADEMILPSVESFSKEASDLNASIERFLETKDPGDLELARNAYVEAYINYQYLAQFLFGPAEQLNFRERVNNFPVNEGQLLTSIENEDYDFSLSMQYDQGFPALDFLLFGQGSNSETTERYTENDKYATYLRQVAGDIAATANALEEEWQDYRTEFIDRTGTAAGASLAQLVNSWNEEYEITKRDRLGIPSGQVTLGFTNPDKVEAYYSQISLDLFEASIEAAQEVFLGKSYLSSENGPGLSDVLDHVSAEKDGEALSQIISDQYQIILDDVHALPEGVPLSELVETEKDAVQSLYVEASKQVLHKKTDLPSILCIAITYVDNPSDSD